MQESSLAPDLTRRIEERALAYSTLQLTTLLRDDLPAHRSIVAEWLGVEVPEDASLEELSCIVETEMAIQKGRGQPPA